MTVTGMSRTDGTDGNVARPPLTDCRARDVLHRVGDKWSVFVIDRLGQGSQRCLCCLQLLDRAGELAESGHH